MNAPNYHHLRRHAARPLDVAIVGMACRFPGSPDLASFWANILAGRDCTSEVPADRWDSSVFHDPSSTANDRVACKRGGYLDAPIPFDAAANGVMPVAVDGGEPEQFLVLDAARAALADAGIAEDSLDGRRVEVVVGRGNYLNRGNLTRLQHGRIVAQTLAVLRSLHPEWTEADLDAIRLDLKSSLPRFDAATVPSQITNATAGRVAGRLGLNGASYVVDAASASSLVALELAARSLAERRSDAAIVGGVYIQSDVDFPMVFQQLGALSRSGRARPFDADADGTLPGEGVGVVVLQRLADAQRSGRRVYAVLKGVGVASDGRGQGIASPSAKGHARAMRRAYTSSGVNPSTIGLIEAHGLGVPAADRAELRALRAVFPPSSRRRLGAVSSLIGHAMPASGMAGLIKSALSLHHRMLPASPAVGTAHPLLLGPDVPAGLGPETRPWVHGVEDHPRRAAINAFGFAGINAHAILEEHSPSADGPTPGAMLDWETEAILLGAPDRGSWRELASALIGWLDRKPAASLKDVAATLNVGQPAFGFRVGIVASSLEDLKARLIAALKRLADPSCKSVRDARGTYLWDEPAALASSLAMLFPGEGSQYPGMLADLCPHFPEVRAGFDTADRLAGRQGDPRLPSDLVFEGAGGDPGLWAMGTAVNVVLSTQWSLYQLLTRLGIRPGVVAGHSSGEFLALAAAGAVRVDRSLEDRIGDLGATFARAEAAGVLPAARLVAVGAGRERVDALCREFGMRVAIDNCPHQVVVAGRPEAADALVARLKAEGTVAEVLPFARAYHTAEFGPAMPPLREFFGGLAIARPHTPIYSCADAARMPEDPSAIRAAAVSQWTRPVEFRQTVEAMHADGARVFLDVGARGNLAAFVEDTLRGRPALALAAHLPRRSGTTQLNHLVAALYAKGLALNPEHLYARRRPSRIDFEAAAPAPSTARPLSLGFPEMRLSGGLVQRLRSRPAPATLDPSAVVDADSPVDDAAMLAYLETMDHFLEAQRDVMNAYLKTPKIDHPSTPSAPLPRPSARAPAKSSPTVLDAVARRTGYPVAMLGLDMDMEADLGIDSIKRVEIVGDLRDAGLVPAGLDFDRLSRCRTLGEVLALLAVDPPAAGPWVGVVRELVSGRSLISTRTLDAATDPVAAHHTLGGRRVSAVDPKRLGLPVVPFTVMAEMLAQAAAMLMPGAALVALRDVVAHRWIKYEEPPIELEIRASADPGRPGEVVVEVFNRGPSGAARPGAEGPVVAGRVAFAESRPSPSTAPAWTLPEAGPCHFDAAMIYAEQWLFHGPALQAVVGIGSSSIHGIEGTLRVLPRGGLTADGDGSGLRTDPIVLDAFTHLLGCWGLDKMAEGDVMFPLRVAEIAFDGDDPPVGDDLDCRITVVERERHRIRAEADIVRADGTTWARIRGWEDWRFHWPGRYRDVFRDPREHLVGERIDLDGDAVAVWLEPPADMGKPVWGDVLEWVQCGPAERASMAARGGPERSRTLRMWGRVAAKEAARRLWLDEGGPAVYPADLEIINDDRGRPSIRPLADLGLGAMPMISIAHTDEVAVALASADPSARPGVDVERVVARGPEFESLALTSDERGWLDANTDDAETRAEWVARLWCGKEAAAKASGYGLVGGPSGVEVVEVDLEDGSMIVQLGRELAEACGWGDAPIRVESARRGEYVWAWTLGASALVEEFAVTGQGARR